MNNDYLWDRTGEPDLEVQELEDVLGTLRYQARPFELPANVRPAPQRKYYPALAIAATIALLVLAAGIWLRIQRQRAAQPGQIANSVKGAEKETPSIPTPRESKLPNDLVAESSDQPSSKLAGLPKSLPHKNRTARIGRRNNPGLHQDELTAAEYMEAVAAKDQLLLALRVTSAKLNLAQRKTQTVPAINNIRYQHKVG